VLMVYVKQQQYLVVLLALLHQTYVSMVYAM
jgi:hypothetical protein